MPLLRIVHQPGLTQTFIASEAISDLATIEISTAGLQYVQQARDANPERAAGVARGGVSSGELVRAIVQGIVSGVICAAAVQAGDRLMIASGGRVTPLNTITPAGAISGYAPVTAISGFIPTTGTGLLSGLTGAGHLILSGYAGGILSGGISLTSPPIFSSGVGAVSFSSGSFAGTSWNTTRIIGKALASGGAGSGISILVAIAG